MTLLSIILVPIFIATLSFFVKKNIQPLEKLAFFTALCEPALLFFILKGVVNEGNSSFAPYFLVDRLGAIVMLTVVLVGSTSLIYSIGYLREEVKKNIIGFHRVRQYFILAHLFLSSMLFAISTVNPIAMWIAIEATTLSTVFLISFYNKPTSIEAAWKYFVVNSIGLLLGFFGTLLYFTPIKNISSAGLIEWNTIILNAGNFDPLILKIAFVFVFIGYGTKVGLAPMHTWLPDAHSKAPSPISALLSGSLLNVAMLAILRFKIITDTAISPDFSHGLFVAFGTVSLIVTSFIIFIQKNYKRLFAYSSIEHMGIVSLGFGFGGIGAVASLFHMVYHSIVKSILFFSAGNIFLKYSSTKMANIGGVLRILPITGTILFIGILAITGVPPFGIFITKIYILSAGIQNYPIIVLVSLVLLAIIFAGFLGHASGILFGNAPKGILEGEMNYFTIIPSLFLVFVLVWMSVFPPLVLKSLIYSASALIK